MSNLRLPDSEIEKIGRKLWYYHTGAVMSNDDKLPPEYKAHTKELIELIRQSLLDSVKTPAEFEGEFKGILSKMIHDSGGYCLFEQFEQDAQKLLELIKLSTLQARQKGFDEGVKKTMDAADSTYSAQLANASQNMVTVIEGIDCIYSKDIFKNSHEQIADFLKEKGLSDKELSAVSGVLARFGWENAIHKVIEVLKENPASDS
jgi:hypothetical protein